MSKDNALELSRRKALGALGTIGIAAAGAGAGTTAFLNDEESFDGNSVQAGTLNLKLEGGVVATNRSDGAAPAVNPASVTVDGESKVLFSFSDVKPGDCYVVHTDEIIEGNPAYLEMSFSEQSDAEKGYEEPEPTTNSSDPMEDDLDDPGQPHGGGELDDRMQVTAYYGGSNNGGDGGNEPLVEPGPINCDNVDTDTEGVADTSDPTLIGTQTLQDAFDKLAEAADGENGDAGVNDEFVPGGGGSALELAPGRYRKYWKFEVPKTVGNEIQGDKVTFSIDARVVQARHNDPSSPFTSSGGGS